MPVYVERRDQFDAVIVNVHLDKAAEVEFVEELLNKDWTPIIGEKEFLVFFFWGL